MKTSFFDLLDTCVVIWLDDIFIFGKIFEGHQKALETVFACLAKHSLYVRLDKYALLLKHIEFLGHILDASGVHM